MTSEDLNEEQEREVESLLKTANLHRMRGELLAAEDVCRKALSIAPKDVGVHEILGDILYDSGKLDAAQREYRAALEIVRDHPSIETKYAQVSIEIGERERQKMIARAMIENPKAYTYRERKPGAALLLGIIPGMGQFYNHEMVKAIVIWAVFLLLILSWALIQQPYPPGVNSVQDFILHTNSFVLVLAVLAFIAWIYGLIDAPIMAEKSSKAAREQAEP